MTKTKTILLFIAAVAVQLAILAAIPAKQVFARMTGRLITIKTAPVDPYDFLSGYYVMLSYGISRAPAGSTDTSQNRTELPAYVVLKEDANNIWITDSVHREWPTDVGPDKVVLKGRQFGDRIYYGFETYFIPEDKRRDIESDLRGNRDKTYGQIKVDRFGNTALIRLLIGDTTYEY